MAGKNVEKNVPIHALFSASVTEAEWVKQINHPASFHNFQISGEGVGGGGGWGANPSAPFPPYETLIARNSRDYM